MLTRIQKNYVEACRLNFNANNTAPGRDWTTDDEYNALQEIDGMSDNEIRGVMGLPIPDRFALFNKSQDDYTYDNAESYWRDANVL